MNKKIKITPLPNPITMQSIEYDWLGRVKKITFRPLEEIKKLVSSEAFEKLDKHISMTLVEMSHE